MVPTFFADRALATFKELYDALLQHADIEDRGASSDTTGDAAAQTEEPQKYGRVVRPSTAEEWDNRLTQWRTHCSKTLAHKDVKYARTVERIIGSPCTIFHCIAYNDLTVLQQHPFAPDGLSLSLHEKLSAVDVSDECRDLIWRTLTETSEASFEAVDAAKPRVPSRLELQQNIKQKKTQDTNSRGSNHEEPPSMAKAFQASMQTLCESLPAGQSLLLENATEEQVRECMLRWAKFAATQLDGVRCDMHCSQDNEAVVPLLIEQFPELGLKSPVPPNAWTTIKQMNGFSTVGSTIPPKMMGRIEDIANKLASDIANGKQDLQSMNLQEIGKQVLSGCDEGDMTNLASRLDDLMPALQSLQQRANV